MRLVLFGPPGAGKGTQAARIAAGWGLPYIGAGEMLREAVRSGSALGRKIEDVLARGELVPDEAITELVAERLRRADAHRGFLLDGYPRTVRQVELLDRILDGAGGLDRVLLLEVPDQLAEQRLLLRAAKGDGGSQRADDTSETIRRRLAIYRSEAAPVLALYDRRGLVARIDGVGTEDEIFGRITAVLGAFAP
jgi:adenylate kinase